MPGVDMGFDQDDKYSFGRVTRYKAVTSGTDVVADLPSRQVLLGNQLPDGSVPDCIASVSWSHGNGALQFAEDGSLFVSAGDGAGIAGVDPGGLDPPGFDNWTHPKTGLKGPTPINQDSGAFRSQDLRSLAGKILRIDPETADGYPSNPFFDGDPASNPSRVWALGLRNPFRTIVFPGTGATDPSLGQPNVIAIGDVGWNAWEELNICTGAENFGWPCKEGFAANSTYQAFNPSSPAFPNCNTAMFGTQTDPIGSWPHSVLSGVQPPGIYMDEQGNPLPDFTGACSIGGTVYTGGSYPDIYDGRIFFGDWGGGFLKTVELDAGFGAVAIRPFGTGVGQIADIQRHPITGDLYYVKYLSSKVMHLRYVDPDGVQPYGCGVNPTGSLSVPDGGYYLGGSVEFELHNPLGTQAPGSATALGVSGAPDPAFPCGTLLPGFAMAGPLASGELLLSLAPGVQVMTLPGPTWQGAPVTLSVLVPNEPSLAGAGVYAQGVIIDPTFGGGSGAGIALTEAVELTIGA
ncbi:MAG: PQQ-dependent sugar dehydrogenase [Planctomycetes bacterium]|nr:PQQ-dependent sugar dehydrogenase [Planctomycetota bacterium]